jgi:hypothetical protein
MVILVVTEHQLSMTRVLVVAVVLVVPVATMVVLHLITQDMVDSVSNSPQHFGRGVILDILDREALVFGLLVAAAVVLATMPMVLQLSYQVVQVVQVVRVQVRSQVQVPVVIFQTMEEQTLKLILDLVVEEMVLVLHLPKQVLMVVPVLS